MTVAGVIAPNFGANGTFARLVSSDVSKESGWWCSPRDPTRGPSASGPTRDFRVDLAPDSLRRQYHLAVRNVGGRAGLQVVAGVGEVEALVYEREVRHDRVGERDRDGWPVEERRVDDF